MKRGAYTGAAGAREGYLEKAGEGTLFLDELGELSPATQVKLLRVLQEREFCRLGSHQPTPLKARVLFATHRNLERMIEEGAFRQDLYFRINALKIEVPALRDRPEDIPELARHFLRVYTPADRPEPAILNSALELMQGYPWPGNVRELENVMQRAAILNEGYSVGPADLPEAMRAAGPVELSSDGKGLGVSFEEQLRDYKLRLVHKAVSDCNGNKTLAAQKLNITRAYLHRLLRQRDSGSLQSEAASV
jgi:DNA-binding NtrC family response regulator